MDPITQGLAGAAVSQAIGIRKLKFYALIIGVFAGMLPDLDILIRSSNPTTFLIYHRQFSHAYSFILLGGLIVAGICLALFKKIRPHWKLVVLTAVLAYATHGLIDGLTSYGTELYWPFSNERVAWDIMAIIDPALTLGLFVGVVVSVLNTTRIPAILAIVYFCLYVAFMSVQHYRAEQVVLNQFTKNEAPKDLRVMPMMGAQLNWYVVYRKDKNIFVEEAKTPLISTAKVKRLFSMPLFTEDMLPAWIK